MLGKGETSKHFSPIRHMTSVSVEADGVLQQAGNAALL